LWTRRASRALRSGVTDRDGEVEVVSDLQEIAGRCEPGRDPGHDIGPRKTQYLESRTTEYDRGLVSGQVAAVDEQQSLAEIDIGAQDAGAVVVGERRGGRGEHQHDGQNALQHGSHGSPLLDPKQSDAAYQQTPQLSVN
jgi:hypothetical protein